MTLPLREVAPTRFVTEPNSAPSCPELQLRRTQLKSPLPTRAVADRVFERSTDGSWIINPVMNKESDDAGSADSYEARRDSGTIGIIGLLRRNDERGASIRVSDSRGLIIDRLESCSSPRLTSQEYSSGYAGPLI